MSIKSPEIGPKLVIFDEPVMSSKLFETDLNSEKQVNFFLYYLDEIYTSRKIFDGQNELDHHEMLIFRAILF